MVNTFLSWSGGSSASRSQTETNGTSKIEFLVSVALTLYVSSQY